MSTTDSILRRYTVYSLWNAISSFRNRQKMLFVYEYCLNCYNKCLKRLKSEKNPKFGSQKISSFVIKAMTSLKLYLFQQSKV